MDKVLLCRMRRPSSLANIWVEAESWLLRHGWSGVARLGAVVGVGQLAVEADPPRRPFVLAALVHHRLSGVFLLTELGQGLNPLEEKS